MCKFTPVLFEERYEHFLCANWIFRLLENHLSNYIDGVICPAIADVKKGKNDMNLKFGIGWSHSISEIAISHACPAYLKSGGKSHFSNRESESTMLSYSEYQVVD